MKKTLITLGALGVTAFAAYKLVNKLNDELYYLNFKDDEDFYSALPGCDCDFCNYYNSFDDDHSDYDAEAEDVKKEFEALSDLEKLVVADTLGLIDLNEISKTIKLPL